MLTRKDRRHSGRITPQPTLLIRALETEGLFLDQFYDDWSNYRDGFRDWQRDFKKIKRVSHSRACPDAAAKRKRMNCKQRMLAHRRRYRKLA